MASSRLTATGFRVRGRLRGTCGRFGVLGAEGRVLGAEGLPVSGSLALRPGHGVLMFGGVGL